MHDKFRGASISLNFFVLFSVFGSDCIASGVILSLGGSSVTVAFDREGDGESFTLLCD